MRNFKDEYQRWLTNTDAVTRAELRQYKDEEIEDAFYRDLEFGTGGLRGIIGAGTNRMNIYSVAKASQGLADYVIKNYPDNKKIAIAYDSRIKSDMFSQVASEVFAANGIEVYVFPELSPTPTLSFAVRYYDCAAGIVITASHNPSNYNGYKVYDAAGCQITTETAAEILREIEKLDIFSDVKMEKAENRIHTITPDCLDTFLAEVKKQSVLFGDVINKDVAIVYSPLNGTGLVPITRVLKESGFTNISVVKEQEKPDGNFPTCPYPNPEIKDALKLGLEYAKEKNADLMLATDPDADRVGIAVRDGNEMKLLTGNEVGMLLLDYICSQRIKHGRMPKKPIMVKTIVTIDMAERIAKKYGVKTVNVLTGFKFIGEVISKLEKEGREKDYIFGFEESYGYLTGTYVRDKDAVDGAFMICEMFALYKARGISLVQKLNDLYIDYGYCLNTLHSYEFAGASGFIKMMQIMDDFRTTIKEIGGVKVEKLLDYELGIDGLPKSNVLKFLLNGNCSVVVRPSGTEPKIKTYISVTAENKDKAEVEEKRIVANLEGMLR